MSNIRSTYTKMKSTFGQHTHKGQLPGREIQGLSPTRGGTRSLAGNASTNSLGRSVGGTKQLAGGANLMPVTGGIPNRFPEKPTNETKLRLIFEEVDVHDDRTLTPEGLRRVVKALNINFSAATVDDLYARADVNKNNQMSFSEFQDFAAHYPLLMDAIYFRSRELIERVRREQLLEQSRQSMEEDSRQERLANQQLELVSADVDAQKKNIEAAMQALKDLQVAEKEFLKDSLEMTRAAETAKTDRNNKNLDYQAAKEAERAALEPLRECQGKIESLEGHIEAYEKQINQLQEKERQLEQMLEDAKRNTQRVTSDMSEANDELEQLKEEESALLEAFEAAQADMATLFSELQEAEDNVLNQVALQRAADQTLKSAREDTQSAAQDKEKQEGRLIPMLEREKQHKKLYTQAKGVLDKSEGEYRAKEADHANYLAFRNQADSDEQPLLDAEVRLREQRYNLDDRDDVHRDQGTIYMNFTGRPDTRSMRA